MWNTFAHAFACRAYLDALTLIANHINVIFLSAILFYDLHTTFKYRRYLTTYIILVNMVYIFSRILDKAKIGVNTDTLTINVGKAVRGSTSKMGPRYARRACGHTPNWAHMAPASVCCLPWASRWVLQSLVPFGDDLLWVLAFFLHLTRPWFALFIGPSPHGLMLDDVTPCPITYLGVFSSLFWHILL
jgi:hypothetical protein